MNFKNILLSGLLFVAIDAVYLTTMSNYFNKLVKNIQGKK